jgi:hypothetical protein
MISVDAKRRLSDWFRQWQLPLRRFLLRRAGVPAADVEDIGQEVFLRLMRYAFEFALSRHTMVAMEAPLFLGMTMLNSNLLQVLGDCAERLYRFWERMVQRMRASGWYLLNPRLSQNQVQASAGSLE